MKGFDCSAESAHARAFNVDVAHGARRMCAAARAHDRGHKMKKQAGASSTGGGTYGGATSLAEAVCGAGAEVMLRDSALRSRARERAGRQAVLADEEHLAC